MTVPEVSVPEADLGDAPAEGGQAAPGPNADATRGDRLAGAIERTIEHFRRRFIPAKAPIVWGAETKAASGHPLKPGEGGYWVAELQGDSTLESDYIFLLSYLDRDAHQEKIQKLARSLRAKQLEDGGWNIYHGGPSDISASVKGYWALKLAGHEADDPVLAPARETILRLGGVERANTFTKLYLAFAKLIDWNEVPAVPAEVVLLPRFMFFNIYEISYWSRVILIPLSVIYALKPDRKTDNRMTLREIFRSSYPDLAEKDLPPKEDPTRPCWRNFFNAAERVVRIIERTPFKPLRKLALKKSEKWLIEHTEQTDGIGAILPSMCNFILAMLALGHDESHPLIQNQLENLRGLEIEEDGAIRMQPCVSPVWDTALALNALLEAGFPADAPEAVEAARWLVAKEVRRPGDWQVRRPGLEPSGWYFQFANEFYPDIDDTAAVLMALDRVVGKDIPGIEPSMSRALNWNVHMQSSDGGWAAFDADVNREAFNEIPYSDHNAMLDPPCADITGRVLESFARFPDACNVPLVAEATRRGIAFLKNTQEEDGCWYGRWGVNYVYGTWQSLKGLLAVGEDPQQEYIQKAVRWLQNCQNDDGGWGETCASYDDPALRGQGESTASQTAWGVMGLIAAGEVKSTAVERGIEYLLTHQAADGSWPEELCTGTGFPKVFYLRYRLYNVFFPLFALGYYRNVLDGVVPKRGFNQVKTPEPLPSARSARQKISA